MTIADDLYIEWKFDNKRPPSRRNWVGEFPIGYNGMVYQFTVHQRGKKGEERLYLDWGSQRVRFKNLRHASIWMLSMQGKIGPLGKLALLAQLDD